MTLPFPIHRHRPALRRVVLGTAVVAAFVVAGLLGGARGSRADEALLPPLAIVAAAQAADAPAVPAPPKAPVPPTLPSPPAASPAPAPGASPGSPAPGPDVAAESPLKHGAEIMIDEKGIRIEKPGTEGRRSRNITVRGNVDGDLDALRDVNVPRWVGPLVFMSVALFFLVPLIAVALVIWYKMRRTRMLNETLLKYAEKGISPPAEALHALGGSAAVSAMEATPVTAPMYEQAKAVRKRVAWSDLRKGVVMGAIGLGLTLFSMFDDGSPNIVGLVLLFVGIGYGVLWYMEDREGRGSAGGVPPGGA